MAFYREGKTPLTRMTFPSRRHLNESRHRVLDLVQDDAEIQLSQHAGDGAFGGAINVRLTGVDGLFRKCLERGLDVTGHERQTRVLAIAMLDASKGCFSTCPENV